MKGIQHLLVISRVLGLGLDQEGYAKCYYYWETIHTKVDCKKIMSLGKGKKPNHSFVIVVAKKESSCDDILSIISLKLVDKWTGF